MPFSFLQKSTLQTLQLPYFVRIFLELVYCEVLCFDNQRLQALDLAQIVVEKLTARKNDRNRNRKQN